MRNDENNHYFQWVLTFMGSSRYIGDDMCYECTRKKDQKYSLICEYNLLSNLFSISFPKTLS